MGQAGGEDGSFELYDLAVVVEAIEGNCTCGMRVGDSFNLRGGKLSLPDGGDFCLYALQAAILSVKLPHLAGWTAARQAAAKLYDEAIASSDLLASLVTRPAVAPSATHVFHQYTLRTPRRDALAKHLAAAGIGTACHYPLPIPGQRMFQDLGYDAAPFPAAWAAAREVLSLACFPELRPDEIDAVIAAVRSFFEGEP